MPHHRYKVGQTVKFTPGKRSMPTSAAQYKIVHRLPREGGGFMYRIKATTEAFERIAAEADITSSQ